MRRPTHLDKAAHPKFEELLNIVGDKIKDGDENLLAVLANAYVDYKDAHNVLRDRGPVLAGETMIRANPAHNMVKDIVKIIESLSAHFGLSIKSRGGRMDLETEVEDELDRI